MEVTNPVDSRGEPNRALDELVSTTSMPRKAQDAPDVVLGEFLVNSALATIIFDSRASHSFISTKFVAKHGFHMVPLRKPLITRSPGVNIKC